MMNCDSCHGPAAKVFWLKSALGMQFLVPLCSTCEPIVRQAGRIVEMTPAVTSNYTEVGRRS